jgi:hypothetical protein
LSIRWPASVASTRMARLMFDSANNCASDWRIDQTFGKVRVNYADFTARLRIDDTYVVVAACSACLAVARCGRSGHDKRRRRPEIFRADVVSQRSVEPALRQLSRCDHEVASSRPAFRSGDMPDKRSSS